MNHELLKITLAVEHQEIAQIVDALASDDEIEIDVVKLNQINHLQESNIMIFSMPEYASPVISILKNISQKPFFRMKERW